MPATPLRSIRQDIQSMHAYAIQASDGMVKLDAMENPFTLPAPLQAALGQRLGAGKVKGFSIASSLTMPSDAWMA